MSVVCPDCGRASTIDARFCDGCGTDLSSSRKTTSPELPYVSDQQTSLGEQTKTVQFLKERIPYLESKLSLSLTQSNVVSRLEEDMAQLKVGVTELAAKTRELEARLGETVPRNELETKETEIQNLTQNARTLNQRLEEFGRAFASLVPRSELEAMCSEVEGLKNEISKLKAERVRHETETESAISSYVGNPTLLITTILALLILGMSFLSIAASGVFAGFCGSVYPGVTCPPPPAISIVNSFPPLWIMPLGAVIVLIIDAVSFKTSRPVRARGLAYTVIGLLNLFALVSYVASISFTGIGSGDSLVVPSPFLYSPFYLIEAASLTLIWFGFNEWSKMQIRWGTRSRPLVFITKET